MNDLINFKLGCPADAVTIDGLSDTLKTFKKLLVAAKAADWRIRRRCRMNDLINFKLGCPADAVTIDGLSDTLKTFKKLLVAAKAADWRIRDVGIHSVAVVAEPVVVDEETDESLRTVRDVVGAVESRDVARMLDYREEVESIIALSAKYSSPVEFGAGGDHTMMTVEDAKKISEMLKRSGRPS